MLALQRHSHQLFAFEIVEESLAAIVVLRLSAWCEQTTPIFANRHAPHFRCQTDRERGWFRLHRPSRLHRPLLRFMDDIGSQSIPRRSLL